MESKILDEVKDILENRNQDYGSKRQSFEMIASIASKLSKVSLTPEMCCNVLIAMKISRETVKHKRDNIKDLIGYLAILDELMDSK